MALKWTQRRGVRDTRVARETKSYLLLFFVRPLESRKTGTCSECLIRSFFLCFHVVYIALCLVGIDHSYFPPAGFSHCLRMLIALFVIFSAAQLSQSAYFALQCPYTVFGLGRTPNFVDELAVGIPRSKGSVRLNDHCLCPKSFKNT